MAEPTDRQPDETEPEETEPGVIRPIEAVLIDIEGTVTSISAVRDVLFPYARSRLAGFVAAHAGEPEVAEILAQTRALVPEADPVASLERWSDLDEKVTPLKTLQGLIWREGYAAGELVARFYPEAPECLSFWKREGLPLYVYSSGSEEAQRGIFGHSQAGDLTGLFGGFFDTRIGPKREAGSYAAITGRIGLPAGLILFLSDIEAELDAAAAAGLRTCQIVREADGTLPSTRHPVAVDLHEVSRLFTLPQSA
jgi:enolase-phosphatase E1